MENLKSNVDCKLLGSPHNIANPIENADQMSEPEIRATLVCVSYCAELIGSNSRSYVLESLHRNSSKKQGLRESSDANYYNVVNFIIVVSRSDTV